MPNRGEPVKRPYHSPVRRERMRATRRAVVEAAGRLFAEQGFGPTSVDAIARAAGVSRATVFSSAGGKAELLRAAYELAVRGDDEPTPLGARPQAREILAERDPYRLFERYAEVIVGIGARFGPLHETLRGAAQTDPELGAFFHGIGDERHGGGGRVVRAAAALGPLRDGLDVESATDVLWVLTDPGLHVALVGRRGWPESRFVQWLKQAMVSQLLPSRS
jgi:AcrR family transcriptional regulator